MPRVLNYITAPNVLIWSAIVASCSMPALFKSSQIMCKDPSDTSINPWSSSESKWIDGSVDGDVPLVRLSELFNVNYFIVSQVNPHVNIFLRIKYSNIFFARSLLFLLATELEYRLRQLGSIGVFSRLFTKLANLFNQEYEGDITIVPDIDFSDYLSVISRTSLEYVRRAILRGSQATWTKLHRIRNNCLIEFTIDKIIKNLRSKLNPNIHHKESVY